MAPSKLPIDDTSVRWGLAEASRFGAVEALRRHGLAGGPATVWFLLHEGRYLDAKAVWRLALHAASAPPEFFEFTTYRAQGVLKKLGYVAQKKSKEVSRSGLPIAKIEEEVARTERWAKILARPKQARFRADLLAEFTCCAFTGTSDISSLEAAHIIPVSEKADYEVSNGILLRVDVHRLFDTGLIELAPNGTINVSPDLRSQCYRKLDGAEVRLSAEALSLRAPLLQRRLEMGQADGPS